jgi:hypothetical protein
MTKFKIGDRVVISSNLKKTDMKHSVVEQMRAMVGKVYPIQNIKNTSSDVPTIFVDSYMFHPDDLIPYEKPKKQPPVTFNPEQLNL